MVLEKIKNLWWIVRNIKSIVVVGRHQHIVEMFYKIMQQIQKTAEKGKPYMSDVIIVNTATGEKLADFVSVWTGAHDGNPLKRLRGVIEQRNILKSVLSTIPLPEDRKIEIELMLKSFD